jgi:site-specific DNA recombinase
VQTAAKKGRPIWAKMLKALREDKAQGVVIHKIDRSARNLKDWADLGELIDQGIEVHFANEALDLHSRGGRLSADIQAVVAADYIRNLREEAKKGIYGRLKQGFYPLRAPIGYLDQGSGKAKTIDPIKGPLVRQAFELYATRTFTLHTLREELIRLGLRNIAGRPVTLNGISVILNNPFYTGVIRIKKTDEVYQGNHEPLISTKLFETVQDILCGRFHTRAKHHELLFRRLIRCAACAYAAIGELRKGHVYYRCHTRTCPTNTVKEEAVETVVAEKLEKLQFTDEEKAYLAGEIRDLKARCIREKEQVIGNLNVRLEQVNQRITKATDAYLDGILERDIFEERKRTLLFERQSIQGTLTDLKANRTSVPEALEKFLEHAGSAWLLYKQADPEQKRRMVKTLSSNLTLRSKTIDFTYAVPFNEIAQREKNIDCSPNQGVHRTRKTWLDKLYKYFAKAPISDFDWILNTPSTKKDQLKANPFVKDGYTYEPIKPEQNPFEGPSVTY